MADSLYDTDYFAWTQEQARLLRDGAEKRANAPVDWENVAEEIESLGRSDARAVRELLGVIVEHLLKLDYSPSREPRRGWQMSILNARIDIENLVDESPSLRARLENLLEKAAKSATRRAAASLTSYGELDAAVSARRHAGSYQLEQVLSDWFPDDPG